MITTEDLQAQTKMIKFILFYIVAPVNVVVFGLMIYVMFKDFIF